MHKGKSKHVTRKKSMKMKAVREEIRDKIDKSNFKMVKISPFVSVISLNVSGLNSQIKRHRVIKWINKI